jgi:Zn-finger nucleic acid-binding protein
MPGRLAGSRGVGQAHRTFGGAAVPTREREANHDRSRGHDKGDYRYKKKHKSLLGELFDF